MADAMLLHGALTEAALRLRAKPYQQTKSDVKRPSVLRPKVCHSLIHWGVTDRSKPTVDGNFPQTPPHDTQMTLRSASCRVHHFLRDVLAMPVRDPHYASRQPTA